MGTRRTSGRAESVAPRATRPPNAMPSRGTSQARWNVRCASVLVPVLVAIAGSTGCVADPPPAQYERRDDAVAAWLTHFAEVADLLEVHLGITPEDRVGAPLERRLDDEESEALLTAFESWVDETSESRAVVARELDALGGPGARRAERLVRYDDEIADLLVRLVLLRKQVEFALGDDAERVRRFQRVARRLDL